MAQALLRAISLGRSVDHRTLFSDLSFELDRGECLVLSGPSGSGKTLLLRTLVGLEIAESGTVKCFGESPAPETITRIRSRMILVPQRSVLPGRSVENVLRAPYDLEVHSGRSFDRDRALEQLRAFGRDPNFLESDIDDLSGGERQIVALTRALLLEPEVLLLDEPTAHLDEETTRVVERTVGAWIDVGEGAAIWTTHDAAQAGRVGRGGTIELGTDERSGNGSTNDSRQRPAEKEASDG